MSDRNGTSRRQHTQEAQETGADFLQLQFLGSCEGTLSHKYKIISLIKKGYSSTIYKAVDEETGQAVAIKQVIQDEDEDRNHEKDVLAMLDHPYCTNLLYSYVFERKNDEVNTTTGDRCLNMVMDYMPEDLTQVLRRLNSQSAHLDPILIKIFSF